MRIHFIAIGGSAMHNLALALHDKGYTITGSDDAIFEPSKSRLEAAGILPEKTGWYPEKLDEYVDAVVLGMHAKADNPELAKAQELAIPIFSYPEFLYEQSKHKTRVVIGGSHGKTTITSMILHAMNYHDRAVDYMVGAQLEGFDRMVKLTDDAEFIVLEGDEYLSSTLDKRPKFHLYKPNIALISGIAWDHINVFPSFEHYLEQFKLFIEQITNGGILVYNEEDQALNELVKQSDAIIKKYPYQTPSYEIQNDVVFLETEEGPMPLEIFGKHNLQNLAGAKSICMHMGMTEDEFDEAIASFSGASKRLEFLFEHKGTKAYKDFAHAPSKVKASVEATREAFGNKKLLTCLELHTYSSLNPEFIGEYKSSLDYADIAWVFYSPKAVALKGLNPLSVDQIKMAFGREDLRVFTDPEAFALDLYAELAPDQTLLFMSSGNYGGLDLQNLAQHI